MAKLHAERSERRGGEEVKDDTSGNGRQAWCGEKGRRRIGHLGVAVAVVLVGSAAVGEPAYVGAAKCKVCHIKQYKSWEQTRMAQSFEVLRPGARAEEKKNAGLDPNADYTGDAECLPCHTTGYGLPGGFESLESTPDMVGIQCESCHGPGSEYLAKDGMSLQNKEYKRSDLVAVGLVVPNEQTCTSACHNERSPFAGDGYVFDFETRKSQGTHEHIPLKYEH